MFWLILGIVIFIAGILFGIACFVEEKKGAGTACVIGGIVLAILFTCLSCVTSVPTGNTGIVTFNCDGLHINALVVLLLHKFFPDLITEGRVSIVMPPLYGASKGKQFIPIYNVNDLEKYKNKGYTTQRFKGLGEMRSDQMRAVFDSNFEYIVQEPKQLEEDIKIITDSAEKRKYLNLTQEFNFEKFLKEIFKERGLKI